MKTGDQIGWLFTYSDGSTKVIGSWAVPHDTEYDKLNNGADMAHYPLYEIARQSPREVVKIELRRMEDMPKPGWM